MLNNLYRHVHCLYIPSYITAMTLRKWKLKKKKVDIVMNRMGQLLWLYWPYLQECHSSTVWSLWVKQKRWLFFCSIQKQQEWLIFRRLHCPMKWSGPHFLQLNSGMARKLLWDTKCLCQKKVIFQRPHHF